VGEKVAAGKVSEPRFLREEAVPRRGGGNFRIYLLQGGECAGFLPWGGGVWIQVGR